MSLNDVFGSFEGRPDHPDFAALVDVVLKQDGKTEDRNFEFGPYLEQFIDPSSITHMAQQRAMRAVAAMGRNPTLNAKLVSAIAATYIDAFMVGYLFHAKRHPTTDE